MRNEPFTEHNYSLTPSWIQVLMTGAVAVAASNANTVCASGKPNVQSPPNIILILADDLGYGDIGSFGAKDIKTPVLDRMAEEGIIFTQHYAGSTVCAPSRSVLMTGLHTGHGSIRGNRQAAPSGQMPLREGTPTIASMLKTVGYNTGMIGKWGLGVEENGSSPNKHGFNYYFGYLDQVLAHNHYPEFLLRNGDRVVLNNVVQYLPETHWSKGLASFPKEMKDYSQYFFTAEAIDFIEKNKDTPFFMYYPVIIPHQNDEALPGKRYSEVPSFEPYNDYPWTEEEKGYAAMVSILDTEIGKLMDKLSELNLDEKTLVIFTSDNGADSPGRFKNISNQPFRGKKRDLYEGGIRVPFIARWPGKISPGTSSDHICAFWDYMPSFSELSGAEMPLKSDGISFIPAMLGENNRQKQHTHLYWENQTGQRIIQAIRLGRWKAIRKSTRTDTGEIELYDLISDPGENNDLSAKHPEFVEQLKLAMQSSRKPDKNWLSPEN